MGCDITAIVERKKRGVWESCGRVNIPRNYTMFSVMANVRNDDGIPPISEPRGFPDDVSGFGRDLLEEARQYGYSASWLLLREMREYDTTQKYYCTRLVTKRDSSGKIAETCGWTSGQHMGDVGEIEIFGEWGDAAWRELIAAMSEYGEDDNVRLLFYFDS